MEAGVIIATTLVVLSFFFSLAALYIATETSNNLIDYKVYIKKRLGAYFKYAFDESVTDHALNIIRRVSKLECRLNNSKEYKAKQAKDKLAEAKALITEIGD